MISQAITWAQALDLYWLARRRDFSRHTEEDYGRTFARFGEHVGNRPVAQIGSRDVHRFLNHAQEAYQLGRKTLSNYWTALSSFWTWAEVELGVEHVIRGRVPRPRYRRRSIRPYDAPEVRALLAVCTHMEPWTAPGGKMVYTPRPSALRDRAMLLTLVDTGVRASELCNLEIRDYNRRRQELVVRAGKGDKERSVYLGQAAGEALDLYLAPRGRPAPGRPLFAARGGGALDRDALRLLIVRLAQRADVAGANVHRFRHTFAINFLRNGGQVLALQALLGHESLETIRIYVQLAQADLQREQQASSPADGWRLSPHGSHP